MGQKTSFMGHITDSTKGRAKRIGRSFRLFQRSPPVFFFFFVFNWRMEKMEAGERKEIPEDGTPRRRVAH